MVTSTKFTKTAKHTSKISGAKAEIFEYYCEWRKQTVYAATLWRNRRAKKVDQRCAYSTPEQRTEDVRRYFQRQDEIWIANEAAKREAAERAKADREAAEEVFKVGDAIYTSWGYDQTNVDFYQIVKRTKAYVWVKPMSSRLVTAGPNYTGTVAPGEVKAGEKAEKHRINIRDGNLFRRMTKAEYDKIAEIIRKST